MRTAVRLLAGLTLLGCAVIQSPAWAGAQNASAATPNRPVVQAPAGAVRGEAIDGVNVFKGLPYAMAPTGWRRWRPPVDMPRWRQTRDASQFGPACHQPIARGESIYAGEAPTLSEDCLFLNIWSPQGAAAAPVFVWIHGGALATGASSETMYDGARMAAAQVQAMEETPTLIGLMRMAREPDVRRGLAFLLAMAGALGRQYAHDPIDYAAD